MQMERLWLPSIVGTPRFEHLPVLVESVGHIMTTFAYPPAPSLCRFIRASRPDAASGPYRLATAFPPQPLDDDSVTIEAAGLANSVVVQK